METELRVAGRVISSTTMTLWLEEPINNFSKGYDDEDPSTLLETFE